MHRGKKFLTAIFSAIAPSRSLEVKIKKAISLVQLFLIEPCRSKPGRHGAKFSLKILKLDVYAIAIAPYYVICCERARCMKGSQPLSLGLNDSMESATNVDIIFFERNSLLIKIK